MKQIEVLPQIIYEFEADQTLLNTTLELVKKEELLEKQRNLHNIREHIFTYYWPLEGNRALFRKIHGENPIHNFVS